MPKTRNGYRGSGKRAFKRIYGVLRNEVLASRENVEQAGSRITDADIAGESAALVQLRILQQTAAAVLAQAGQAPALALTLLLI